MSEQLCNGVEQSIFFDRDEGYFVTYVTEELGLPADARDDDIIPLMHIDLKGKEVPGIVLPQSELTI